MLLNDAGNLNKIDSQGGLCRLPDHLIKPIHRVEHSLHLGVFKDSRDLFVSKVFVAMHIQILNLHPSILTDVDYHGDLVGRG